MDNPFFKNNGPFKLRDILKDLNFINDQISIGTLIANDSAVDGRIKVITPSEDLRNDYRLWLEYLAK